MHDNVVYLNRDVDVERRLDTESQLSSFKIKALRFPAIERGLQDLVVQPLSDLGMNIQQASCLVSHLEIIRTCGLSDMLVFEDDIDLSPMSHWTFTFDEVVSSLPDSVGIAQLFYFPLDAPISAIKWKPGMFGTSAYFIKKEYAEYLVSTGYRDGKWDIDSFKSNYVQKLADSVLYSNTKTMSILLFGVRNEVSTILPHATSGITASELSSKWRTNPPTKEQLLTSIEGFK